MNNLLKIIKNLNKGKSSGNIGVLAISTFFSYLFTIIFTPILSRTFLPETFGQFTIFLSIATVFGSFIDLTFSSRIVLPEKDSEGNILFKTSIIISFILSALIVTIFLIFRTSIKIGISNSFFIVAIITSFIIACLGAIDNLFIRQGFFKKISLIRVLRSIITPSLSLIFFYNFFDDYGLVAGYFFSAFFLILLFFPIKVFYSKMNIKALKEIVNKHNVAIKYQLPTKLFDTLSVHLPFLLIGYYFSNDTLGNYKMAYSLVSIPYAILGTSIGPVFFKKFKNNWPNEEKSKKLINKTLKAIIIFLLIPYSILFFFGTKLILIFLGESWILASSYVQILCVVFFIWALNSSISQALIIMNCEKHFLYFNILRFFQVLISYFIGFNFFNDIIYCIYFTILMDIIYTIFFQTFLFKRIKS